MKEGGRDDFFWSGLTSGIIGVDPYTAHRRAIIHNTKSNDVYTMFTFNGEVALDSIEQNRSLARLMKDVYRQKVKEEVGLNHLQELH